jgi:hypothetical protein
MAGWTFLQTSTAHTAHPSGPDATLATEQQSIHGVRKHAATCDASSA